MFLSRLPLILTSIAVGLLFPTVLSIAVNTVAPTSQVDTPIAQVR